MDLGFRIACAGLLVLSALTSAHYYRKAGPVERLAYGEREGVVLAVARGVWVVLAVAFPILYALRPEWLDWGRFPEPLALRAVLGTCLAAAHATLLVWAHRALGPNFSSSLRMREGHELITTGPYRWVRHPLYGAALLLYAGLGVLSANWPVGLGGITFILFILLVRTPREEQMLLEAFGAEYSAYRERTGRVLPRIPWR